MKMRQLPPFLLGMFCAVLLSAAPVTFEVTVRNPTDAELSLDLRKTTDAEYPTTYRMPLRDGVATFELDVPFAQIMRLRYAGQEIPFHVAPTDKPRFSFDGNDPLGTVKFAMAKNNAVVGYFQKFVPKLTQQIRAGHLTAELAAERYDAALTGDYETYEKSVSSAASAATKYLNGQRNALPQSVYVYLAEDLRNRAAAEKLAYLAANPYAPDADRVQRRLGSSVNGFGNLDHPTYRNYLRTYAIYSVQPAANESDLSAAQRMYDQAGATLDGAAEAYLRAEILLNYFYTSGDATLAERNFPAFAEAHRQSPQIRRVIDGYEGQLNTLDPSGAPDIEMLRADNQFVEKLSDYRGKVVYISFWASWCKPCIANFKKSEQLRRDLQDMGVELLNISIDSNEAAFRRGLDMITPVGTNTLALQLNQTKLDYNLVTIPAYFIIDRQGQFAYLSGGADRNIREEFRKIVNQ